MIARLRFSSRDGSHLNFSELRKAFIIYLLTKKMHGTYIFRLDNAQQREENSNNINSYAFEDLNWLGLIADESPLNPNPALSPYVQSERHDIYQRYVNKLLAMQMAYKKIPPKQMGASLSEIHPATYFRMSSFDDVAIADLRLGKIAHEKFNMHDWMIMASDGQFTSEFAAMIDDHLMNITHVVCELDNLPNLGRFVSLYRALNWSIPAFLHLTNLKFENGSEEINVLRLRDDGYLPEAICNYLYNLDIIDAPSDLIVSLEYLIKGFDIKKMKNGHQLFDIKVLRKINSAYIKQMNTANYATFIRPFINPFINDIYSDDDLLKLAAVFKTQISYGREIEHYLRPFLLKVPDFTPREQQMINNTQSQFVISSFKEAILGHDFISSNFSELIYLVQMKIGIAGKDFYQPLRLLLTRMERGPELEEIIKFLGKEETLKRLNQDND